MIDQLEHVYTQLSSLRIELERRAELPGLSRELISFACDGVGEPFPLEPAFAAYSRSIITPNLELSYFLELAHDAGLTPRLLEYDGKLVGSSPDKLSLAKMQFYQAKTLSDKRVTFTERLVDMNEWEGEPVFSVMCKNGESLRDLHHRLLNRVHPHAGRELFDITQWFNTVRTKRNYYTNYLALFVAHGVLFENFILTDPAENAFFAEKVLPSVEEIEKRFGMKPLIYPLLPIENEKNLSWLSYDASLLPYVQSQTKGI